MSWYKEGSVNITQGSNTVIGVGTKWANPLIGVCAGQMLILKTANTIEICEIASVQSDTKLTLANQYSGASKKGVSYEIPTAPNVSIEALALRISEMLNYYQLQMNGWQSILTGTGDITLTAPDGSAVKIKSQKALTEAINNTIKKSGEENQSIDGSLDVKKITENSVRVYSPNNKPSADDIGAIAATKTVVNGAPTYMVGEHVVFSDMVGDQRLMPFRTNELPFGWYFRNGDNYLLSSPQGQALNSLSENYKADHLITIKEIDGKQYINVPNAFHSDGRGYFERAVDGISRQVGHVEPDAIRNIWGELIHVMQWIGSVPYGVFSLRAANGGSGLNNRNSSAICNVEDSDFPERPITFDASKTVPTAEENRPLNIGMTPTIYLGV